MGSFNLNKVKAREVPLSLSFDDEVLEVAYKPRELRYADVEDLSKAEDPDRVIKILAKVISRWNMTNGSNKPVPITVPELKQLPHELLDAIGGAVLSDMFPNLKTPES